MPLTGELRMLLALPARREAVGWSMIYGMAWGMSGAAWQDAAAAGRPFWTAVFATYLITLLPAYYALQWRSLTD